MEVELMLLDLLAAHLGLARKGFDVHDLADGLSSHHADVGEAGVRGPQEAADLAVL